MISLAGRIVKKREQGKLLFYGLKADGANVQVMASLSDYEGGEEAFWKVGGHQLAKRFLPPRRLPPQTRPRTGLIILVF